MRLQHVGGEEFEGRIIGPELVLVRGCVGGLSPKVVHPDTLMEDARCLTERRQGSPNRRRQEYIGMLPRMGRRRADLFTWDEDQRTVEAHARVRRASPWPGHDAA